MISYSSLTCLEIMHFREMATTDKLQEYRVFTLKLKKMMLAVGLWPFVEPNFFHRILPNLVFLVILIMCFVIFNFIWTHHPNMMIMLKGLGSAGSYLNTILKILCVILNWDEVKELHETLDLIFNELLLDKTIQHIILKKITAVRQLSTVFSAIVFVSVTFNYLTPMMNIIIQYIHHIHPIKYLLPIPAVYPWPITGGSVFYYCHYAFELLGGYILLFVNCGMDAFFPIHIFQMSGQLKAMSYRLNNLKDGDDHGATIRECVSKYRVLLRCRDIIETIYGPIILWMLVSCAIVLCALTFQISKLDSFSIGRVIFLVTYVVSKLMQAFIYSWSGSVLTFESELFTRAIYASNWAGTGRQRFMTSVLIMLTQRPLVITACSFSAVSVDMFSMIFNTTLSYYFLLKTVEDKAA